MCKQKICEKNSRLFTFGHIDWTFWAQLFAFLAIFSLFVVITPSTQVHHLLILFYYTEKFINNYEKSSK